MGGLAGRARLSQAVEDYSDKRQLWIWAGIAAGVALGVAGVIYLVSQNDAPRRLERLLRRCEDRIHGIENSLARLEPGPATP